MQIVHGNQGSAVGEGHGPQHAAMTLQHHCGLLISKSQTRMVPSQLAEASIEPSGDQATCVMVLRWPPRNCSSIRHNSRRWCQVKSRSSMGQLKLLSSNRCPLWITLDQVRSPTQSQDIGQAAGLLLGLAGLLFGLVRFPVLRFSALVSVLQNRPVPCWHQSGDRRPTSSAFPPRAARWP